MKFTKMHGIGNDYVYVNCFEENIENGSELAVKVSDRHFGIGSDGLILICPSKTGDAEMIMYNSDGTTSEMCGNGVRCVAKFIYDNNIARKENLNIQTGAGLLNIDLVIENDQAVAAKVNMGNPILNAKEIPSTLDGESVVSVPLNIGGQSYDITLVSMGNPHCIIYVDDVKIFPVQEVGPLIENHKTFPRRTNVEFVQVLSPTEVIQRTWERGAGETLACGTGASAVCVAGVLNNKTERKIKNHLTGGDLELEWTEEGSVFMTGPAETVFTGEWK